jgi:hypothetical protein
MIAACPVCGSTDSFETMRRTNVPVLMNRLYATPAAARSAPAGELDIRSCGSCGFSWNIAFDPGIVVYDGEYENNQTHSNVFNSHLTKRADDIVASIAHD